jgi:diguanylate cyclase (GGDEF)-like protein/PAS domain S-box-containing protein
MCKNVTGVITEVDDLVLNVLGLDRKDMLGHRSTEFLHPDDHEQAFSSWVRMLSEPGTPHTIQVRHRNSTGRWLWVEATNTVDPADHSVVHTELVLIDRPPDDRTSVSNQLLRHLAEALPLGIAQIDGDRRIVFSNAKLAFICGRAGSDHLSDWLGQVLPADHAMLEEAVESVLTGVDTEIELSLIHPDRGERRCNVILSALAGRSGYGTTGALLCITDITSETQERADIIRRAALDGLTGCLNRAAVLEKLAVALLASTDTAGVAAIFIDLDDFKHINDTYGHAAGDYLLTSVAQRLRAKSRDAQVGRLGGDEFLVIAANVPSADQAERLGSRLMRALAEPMTLDNAKIYPAASVGVAWSADPATDAADLVARADEAMYAAKRRSATLSKTAR